MAKSVLSTVHSLACTVCMDENKSIGDDICESQWHVSIECVAVSIFGNVSIRITHIPHKRAYYINVRARVCACVRIHVYIVYVHNAVDNHNAVI